MHMHCHNHGGFGGHGDFGLFYGRVAYDAGTPAPAEAPKPFVAPEKLDQSDEMKKLEGLRNEAELKSSAVREANKAVNDRIDDAEKKARENFDKSDKSAEGKTALDAYIAELTALRGKARGIYDELRDKIEEQRDAERKRLTDALESLRTQNADLQKGKGEWQQKLSEAKFKETLDRLGNLNRDDFDVASKKIAESEYHDFSGSDNAADKSDSQRYENYENVSRSRTEGYLRAMIRMEHGDDAHRTLVTAYHEGSRGWIDRMITEESLEKNTGLTKDVEVVDKMIPAGTFLTQNERVYVATLYREAERIFGIGSAEKAGAYREFLEKRIKEITPKLAENAAKGRLAKNNPEEYVKCARVERNLVMHYLPTPQEWVANPGKYANGPESAPRDPETALHNKENRTQYQKNLDSFVARMNPLVKPIKGDTYKDEYIQRWRGERDSGVAKQNPDGTFYRKDITDSHIVLQQANMQTGVDMYVKYWQDSLQFVAKNNPKAAQEATKLELSARLETLRTHFWDTEPNNIKSLMTSVSKVCGAGSPEPVSSTGSSDKSDKKETPDAKKKEAGTGGARGAGGGGGSEKASGKPSSRPSSGKGARGGAAGDVKKDDKKVDDKKPAEKKDEAAETVEEKIKRIEREIRKDRLPALAPADKMHFKVEKAGDGFQVLFKKEVLDMITHQTGFVDGVPLSWILTPGGDMTIDKQRATVKDGEYVSDGGLYARVKHGSILTVAGAPTAGAAEKPSTKPAGAESKPEKPGASGRDVVGDTDTDSADVLDSYPTTHMQSVEDFLKDPKNKEKFDGSLSPNQRKMYGEFIAQGMNPGSLESIDKGSTRAWLVHTPTRGKFYWSAERPTKEKPYPSAIRNLNEFVLDRYVKEFNAWVDTRVNMGVRAIAAAERLARTDSEQHKKVVGTKEIYEGTAGLVPEAFGRTPDEQQVGILVRGLLKDMSKNKVLYTRTVEFGQGGELETEAYSYIINGEKIDGATITGGRPKGNRGTRVIYREYLSRQVREEIVKRVVKNGNLG